MDIVRKIKRNRVISCTFSNSEQAKEHAARNAVLQICVGTIAFILMMMVFPAGTVQKHTVSKQQAYAVSVKNENTGDIFADNAFTSKDKKLQTVYFGANHIYQITLYMKSTAPQDDKVSKDVVFRLYNDEFSCIYETDVDSKRIEREGCLVAVPDMEVEQGKPYYYEILVDEEGQAVYALPVADRDALGQTENGTLYIDGIINDEVCLIADFVYTSPLTAVGIVMRYLLIVITALAVYLAVQALVWVYDEYYAQDSQRIGKYIETGVAALSLLAAGALFVCAVCLNQFGGAFWDRLFFAVGIVVLEAWLLGALWRRTRVIRPKKRNKMPTISKMCLVWRNYIQTVSFALLFYALCQYVNADRNFYHYTNTRWMLIFFAVALLMNYSEKQFVNKLSAVWLVLAAVGSAFYCRQFAADENELLLARLTCGVVAAWGLLLLNIILNQLQTRAMDIRVMLQGLITKRQKTVYAGLWVVFCILMVVYRYEKVWVFTASLPFIAYIFSRSTPTAANRFLKNFGNGILLSFALVTVFCLHHRPHHYWMLYRYGGIFHTVACTGMYLAVVLGAALAKLYGKLKARKNMIKYCYGEYFVTACVAGFILLTMSRTAFLTTIVTVLAIVILSAVTYHKGVKRVLSELGVLTVVCLVSFPMVFSAVRMVPAVVNDPIRYEIEFQDKSFMIYEGDSIDSDKYMTVGRFFTVLFGRFQSQENAEETADAGLTLREAGMLAGRINGFAGLDMRTAESGDNVPAESHEEKIDISNGRFEIFRDYFKVITLKGHPKMGPENSEGEEYAHAHNSYLQVAYNFGMIAGVIFLVLCVLTLWRSIRLFISYGNKYSSFLLPFALVIVFGFISLTEWAFHPCIPAGFCFILMQMVLMHMDIF